MELGINGKKYNGTCNIYFNDSILWKTRTYKRGYMIKESSYYPQMKSLNILEKVKSDSSMGNILVLS